MKDKEKLSIYVDITRITITLCWVALIAFWCLKLFGGNWFEIMVENENFIKFSELVQNTWLKYLLSFFTVFIANFLILSSISQKFYFKDKELAIVCGLIVSVWIVSNFVSIKILYLPFWYAYFIMIVWGITKQKGIKKLFGVLAIIFQFAFTTLSMLVRNIPIEINTNYFVSIILSIDTYIMFALYYLYSNLLKLQEEQNMIIMGFGWLGKAEAQERGYNSFKRFFHNVGYALSFRWAKKTK